MAGKKPDEASCGDRGERNCKIDLRDEPSAGDEGADDQRPDDRANSSNTDGPSGPGGPDFTWIGAGRDTNDSTAGGR